MIAGKGSSFALAFLCTKALMPVRAGITLTATPMVHRWAGAAGRRWGCTVSWVVLGISRAIYPAGMLNRTGARCKALVFGCLCPRPLTQ